MSVETTRRGALLDGTAHADVQRFIDEAERVVAQDGVNLVQTELRHVLRHPTGYYQSKIATDRASTGWAVHDSGVVYGPWLAGTSSRNHRSRFKGYQHWRRARQALEAKSGEIAGRVLGKYLDGMR